MFEFRVAVEHLDGEQRAAQGGAEGRADPAGHAGKQQDAPVHDRQAEFGGDKGAETGADLGDRAFAPGASAGTDGDHRGDGFDQRNPLADHSSLAVKGFNRSVGAVSFRFRSEFVDQPAGAQATQGRQHKQEPAMRNLQAVNHLGKGRFRRSFQRRVESAELSQHQVFDTVGGKVEDQCPAAGNDADQHGQDQQSETRAVEVAKNVRNKRHGRYFSSMCI